MTNQYRSCFIIIMLLMLAAAVQAEQVSTGKDRQSVSLTIYNLDLAMVRDIRNIPFLKGEQAVTFKNISSRIMPETALIKGSGIDLNKGISSIAKGFDQIRKGQPCLVDGRTIRSCQGDE